MKLLDDWTPDTPDYPNFGISDCNNVFVKGVEQQGPSLAYDYAPFNAPTYVNGYGLNGRCQGFIVGKDNSANVYNFAMSATDIFELGYGTITNVSKTAGIYGTQKTALWSTALYGNRVVATNGLDTPQTFVLGTDTKFSDLASGGYTAPVASCCAVIKDFLVLGGLTSNPTSIQWSGIDQPSYFPTPGSNAAQTVQADTQTLTDGGWVTSIVGGVAGIDGLIFTEKAVWKMQYSGYPTIFAFQPIDRSHGTTVPGSVINQGTFVAYLGPDGFYMYDGSNMVPIGKGKVDKWFYSNVNQNFMYRITSSLDPINRLILWSFPSNASNDGTPDTVLIYNYAFQAWSKATFSHEYIATSLTNGETLTQLNSYGSLSNIPYPLGSRVWKGGNVLLTAFSTSHTYGYIGNTCQDSYITTDMEVADGGTMSTFTSVRPITDCLNYKAQIGTRFLMSDDATWSPLTSNNINGECPVRATGRYNAVKIFLPSGQTWDHLSGYEISGVSAGLR